MNNRERAKQSSTFCIFPFVNIATKTDGSVKLCCRSKSVGNINKQDLKSIWNSERYREVREQFLRGERPTECGICWDQEDAGMKSRRQRTDRIGGLEKYLPQVDKMSDDGTMPFEINIVEAKLSNLCNLKCRMCHPLDSSSWGKDWAEVQDIMETEHAGVNSVVQRWDLTKKPYMSSWDKDEIFWEQFAEFLPSIDRIEFAGGEPLIDPIHYKILHMFIDAGLKPQLKYVSNLTKLDYHKDNVLDLWNNFDDVVVTVSIDGVRDVYNYIRQLSDYDIVKQNIHSIKQHPKVSRVIGACTFQMYNALDLAEIYRSFVEDLDIDLHSHRVNHPEFLDARVMPSDVKQIIVDRLDAMDKYICDTENPRWSPQRKISVRQHIKDNKNFLLSADLSHKLDTFVKYTERLDRSQGVNPGWESVLVELYQSIKKGNNNDKQ